MNSKTGLITRKILAFALSLAMVFSTMSGIFTGGNTSRAATASAASVTLSSLAVGDTIVINDSKYDGKSIEWRVVDKNESKVILESVYVLCKKAYDAKEPGSSDSNRQSYGSNAADSNLQQWLNSTAGANAWYSSRHSGDQAPEGSYVSENPYTNEAGFLSGFSAMMRSKMMDVSTTVCSPVGGGVTTVSGKVFLPSMTEVGLGSTYNSSYSNGQTESGSIWEYYNQSNTNERRIKKYQNSSGAAAWYWLRSPNAGISYNVCSVSTDGGYDSSYAYYGSGGVAPACALPSDTVLSRESDGGYTFGYPVTINYNANGGTGTMTSETKSVAAGGSVSFAANAFTKTGYVFDGWSETANGTAITSKQINAATTINLYARWKPGSITLRYNSNYSGGAASTSESKQISSSVSLATNTFVRSGYEFKGWSATPNGNTITTYDALAAGKNDGDTVDLYAIWDLALVYEMRDGKKVLTYCSPAYPDNPQIAKDCDVIAKGAFDGCTNIHNVTVPYNVSEIEEGAFTDIFVTTNNKLNVTVKNPQCKLSLMSFNPTKTTITSWAGSTADQLAKKSDQIDCKRSITEITKDFVQGEIIKSLIIPSGVTSIADAQKNNEGAYIVGTGVFEDNSDLRTLDLGNVVSVGARAFYHCWNLDCTLIIPPSVTHVGANAFQYIKCPQVIIKTSGVDTYVTEFKDINGNPIHYTAPQTLNKTVITSDDIDPNASGIIIGPSVQKIDDNAFMGNKKVFYVDMSGATSLKEIGDNAFKNSSITAISLPNTVEKIGDGAFAGTAIKSVSLPNSVTDLGDGAFMGCSDLVIADLGGVTEVGDNTFKGCSNLSYVEGTENFSSIGSSAFEGTGITQVTLGKDLTNIGEDAFKDSDLKNVTVENPGLTGISDAMDLSKVTVTADNGSLVADEVSNTAGAKDVVSTGKTAYKITLSGVGTVVYAVKNKYPSNVAPPNVAGKTFLGYFENEGGTGTQWYNSAGVAIKTFNKESDITLYPKFDTAKTTINYNANGGSGSMEASVYEYGSALRLRKNTFTRQGFAFAGWSLNPTSNKVYDDEALFVDTVANVTSYTVYAVWEENAYTISYNANGGTGTMDVTKGALNTAIKLPKNTFTRSGYVFAGWGLTSDAKEVAYADEATLPSTFGTKGDTKILYAIWNLENAASFTVTYDGNGGEIVPPESAAADKMGVVTITSTIPTRSDNKTFLGWATSKDSKAAEFEAGDKMTITKNTTLYAVWADADAIEVIVTTKTQKADGTYEEKETKASAKENAEIELTDKDYTVPEGYTLSKESVLKGKVTKDLKLTVIFDRVKAKLTYDANGVANATMPAEVEDIWGKEITLSTDIPSADGMTFAGWGETKDATVFITKAALDKNGTTVYAIWKAAEALDVPAGTLYTISSDGKSITVIYPTMQTEVIDLAAMNYTLSDGENVIVYDSTVLNGKYQIKVNYVAPGADPEFSYKSEDGTIYEKSGSGAIVKSSKSSIKKIVISDTVKINGKKVKVTTIGKNAFKNRKKATSIKIGKNVKTIKSGAFAGCTKVKTVTIKSTVLSSIAKGAFSKMTKTKFKLSGSKAKKAKIKKLLIKAGIKASKIK